MPEEDKMMMRLSFLLWLLLAGRSYAAVKGEKVLQDSLRYYETLRKDQLTWQHLTHVLPHRTVVRFSTHGRTLHLNLTPHPTIWSKDFSAVTEDNHGRQKRLSLSRNHFYTGTVLGANGSSVSAHLPADDLLTAVVRISPGQVYHVERSHLHIHEPHDFHMITYLESDIKPQEKEILLDSVMTGVEVAQGEPHVSGEERRRLRRQASSSQPEMSCGMAIVADHRFTAGFADGSLSLAASLMVAHIMDIDSIYRSTRFNGSAQTFSNYGLQIRRLIVHENATANPAHYNRAEPFGSDQLLTAFASSDWSDVCLAHLFTYHQFTDGRLGLAYIASTSTAGGICDTTRRFDSGIGSSVSFNSGFSSYLNPSGRQLLQQEGIHATAHEIGHGWGSDHDPSTTSGGGPYLMYPFALSGESPSHRTFSSASQHDIGRVLEVRGGCFQETSQEFCGDGIVGSDEECDLGFGSSEGADQCCDGSTCKLLPGATCSDRNHVCCSRCQPASNNSICRRADRLNCKADTLCNGVSEICPEADVLPDGSECLLGQCRQDNDSTVECIETCELMGMETCTCSSDTLAPEVAACRVCCLNRTTSTCEDLNRNRSTGFGCQYPVPSNMKMTVLGACEEGVCIFSADFFRLAEENPGIVTAFARFLATNIVGTVAFLTFVVFLFPSLALHFLYDRYYYDKYIKKLHINKDKAVLHKRRRTYREKPQRDGGERAASMSREDRTSSNEHLLPSEDLETLRREKVTKL